MAKSRKLEDLTAALNHIRPEPTSELGLATLEQAIHSRYGVAVAQAARIVSEAEMLGLIPNLVAAFDRFLVKPKENDPGCRAKQAIAEALYRLEHRDETLFLKGIRHVQREPVWGGQVDTAPKLRGTCALGLVRMNYPAVMVELADLLADPEPEARIAAARAIAYSENDLGVALLRLRIKVGDTPPVLGECVAALLKLAAGDSLPLAQTLLEAGRKLSDSEAAVELAEVTALVLGESRLPEALPILQDWWQRTTHPELRRTALFASATLRQDKALQFLLDLLIEGSSRDAEDALKALELYKADEFLWPQVEACLAHRNR
ncbi:MAG: hypothetical protein HC929_20270 [Leptolyngbyaceae cyanobacterium SM2_5_2]|nr:hypothetical protein [Leptolyngbyaceae cyanobacterium SM2_5_2]